MNHEDLLSRDVTGMKSQKETEAGWWCLEHDFDFPMTIGKFIIPTDELIFFRGIETTNQPSILGVPMNFPIFLWFSHGFPIVFLWISIFSLGFSTQEALFQRPDVQVVLESKLPPARTSAESGLDRIRTEAEYSIQHTYVYIYIYR